MKSIPYLIALLTVSLLSSEVSAEDIYIAQNARGSDSGVDAADAHSTAWFNSASNWGAGVNKISPGDTAHLVGTITSTLSIQSSGTSGNPITVRFETGASISMPSIPTTGAIRLGSYNYLVIDGGQNGIIESTANGSGMGQVSSQGINGTPSVGNITIKNLTIQNLYVRSNLADGVSPIGIYLYGVMSNIMVSNCSLTWCHQGVALLYGVGNSYNFQVVSNQFNHINHGTIFGSGNNGGAILNGAVWSYNQADYFGDWDQPSGNAYHHNGFYAWADHVSAMITNISITHNVVGGHYGNSSYGTSGIYLSASPGIGIFNLLLADNVISFTTGGANDGAIYLFNVKNSLVANNTLYDASSKYNGVRCDPTCTGVTFSNNIFSGFALNYYLVPGATTKPASCDYNIYFGGQFRVDSAYYSFASWKGLGYDANSKTNNPLFNSVAVADYTLASNSPAIGMGVNLAALFNSDINNKVRPSGGWTVGAYEYQTGAANTSPVIKVLPGIINFGSVTANGSVTNTFTIYNTGGGTLVGTASVGMPFNVISGANYSLTNNQSQIVMLAFNPTSPGSFTQTVNFTSGGTNVAVSGVAVSAGQPPAVSAIGINASDVDAGTPGFQIYGGTVVSLSATATNALAYQWSYSVNGGAAVVFQSGSGAVPAANFNFGTSTIGNTYVWTLSVSNNQGSAQSQFILIVESPPVASTGLTFAAQSGLITNPFVLGTNGTIVYIYQPIQTIGINSNGVAVYNFSITNAGNYEVQALVNAPNGAANSLYVNIDAMPQDPNMIWDVLMTSGFEERLVSWRGNGSDTANQFVPWIFNLTTGSHQIIFCGREANTQLGGLSILPAPPTPAPPTVVGQ